MNVKIPRVPSSPKSSSPKSNSPKGSLIALTNYDAISEFTEDERYLRGKITLLQGTTKTEIPIKLKYDTAHIESLFDNTRDGKEHVEGMSIGCDHKSYLCIGYVVAMSCFVIDNEKFRITLAKEFNEKLKHILYYIVTRLVNMAIKAHNLDSNVFETSLTKFKADLEAITNGEMVKKI